MHRPLVALLCALDAVIAAVAGLAAVLATLTALWVFGLGQHAQWGALWPAAAAVWQLGHLVPLSIHLPEAYQLRAGIPADAASFTLSLAPLALAVFTAVFGARSGARAARAGAWPTGVAGGVVVFAVLSGLVGVSARNPIAAVHLWQAVLFPPAIYAAATLAGALVTDARRAEAGALARWRARAAERRRLVAGIATGATVALAALIAVAAALVAVTLVLRGGQVIALSQAANLDPLGATLMLIGELAYLPTLVIWALSWLAGPGFAVGVGSAVSPAGSQLGVVPGIPLFGLLPDGGSPWLLVLVLLPVAAGALAGRVARARSGARSVAGRAALACGIAVATGVAATLLACAASGSLGPGRLSELGPAALPVGLAVAIEVLLGAAIALGRPAADPSRAPSDPDRAETAPVGGPVPLPPVD